MDARDRKSDFWRRCAAVALAAVLTVGLMGCSVDDIFSNFNVGDVPFEEGRTSPTDMGVVDNRPGIPEDEDFDDLRYDPI